MTIPVSLDGTGHIVLTLEAATAPFPLTMTVAERGPAGPQGPTGPQGEPGWLANSQVDGGRADSSYAATLPIDGGTA